LPKVKRCEWSAGSELEINYHDQEWGNPLHDDQKLFEFILLEGAQAGLSWTTILRKRENYRKAFDGFDAAKIARYREARTRKLMEDAGIVRNRLKIASAVGNAKAFLKVVKEFGSFDSYIWGFVEGTPKQNQWKQMSDVPAQTDEAVAMSKDLKQRGFNFVGPTICYAFMQATGMVNDHLTSCFRYREVATGG
jgi:DNA-3-methyladenine glycosylase I